MVRDDDIVTASEIAGWAWCPESWRLDSLGNTPENQAELRRGEEHHARKAIFEVISRLAIFAGYWLLAAAVFLASLAIGLMRLGR